MKIDRDKIEKIIVQCSALEDAIEDYIKNVKNKDISYIDGMSILNKDLLISYAVTYNGDTEYKFIRLNVQEIVKYMNEEWRIRNDSRLQD